MCECKRLIGHKNHIQLAIKFGSRAVSFPAQNVAGHALTLKIRVSVDLVRGHNKIYQKSCQYLGPNYELWWKLFDISSSDVGTWTMRSLTLTQWQKWCNQRLNQRSKVRMTLYFNRMCRQHYITGRKKMSLAAAAIKKRTLVELTADRRTFSIAIAQLLRFHLKLAELKITI